MKTASWRHGNCLTSKCQKNHPGKTYQNCGLLKPGNCAFLNGVEGKARESTQFAVVTSLTHTHTHTPISISNQHRSVHEAHLDSVRTIHWCLAMLVLKKKRSPGRRSKKRTGLNTAPINSLPPPLPCRGSPQPNSTRWEVLAPASEMLSRSDPSPWLVLA